MGHAVNQCRIEGCAFDGGRLRHSVSQTSDVGFRVVGNVFNDVVDGFGELTTATVKRLEEGDGVAGGADKDEPEGAE